jgi:hypothetical protein
MGKLSHSVCDFYDLPFIINLAAADEVPRVADTPDR